MNNDGKQKDDGIAVHLFPALYAFWFFEKTKFAKIHNGGTVLKIQLTRDSPTNTHISKNRDSVNRASGN